MRSARPDPGSARRGTAAPRAIRATLLASATAATLSGGRRRNRQPPGNDGTWAETRVWDGVTWRPAPRRHDGAVLADRTVHADAIAPQSVTADKLSVHDLSALAAELGAITVDRAHIADIVISRQLQVDNGSLGLATLQVRRTAKAAITASWIVESSVPISAWGGANNTHLATAGLDNTSVNASTDDPPDVLFGVQTTVLPLTIWSGPQVLRLKLDLWTRKVTAIRPTMGETWRIDWRPYGVT